MTDSTNLSDVTGFYFSLRTLALFALLEGMGLYFSNQYLWIVLWCFNALLFLSFFSLMHWCVHNTLFKTQLLNDTFGHIFAALTLDIYACYKYLHYAHHGLTDSAEDQAQDNSDRFDNVHSLSTYIIQLLWYFLNPLTRVFDYYAVLYRDQRNKDRFFSKHRVTFFVDITLSALAILALIVLAYLYPYYTFNLFLAPFIISLPCIFFLDIARHHDTNPHGQRMEEKVRTMTGNWFTRFISVYANYHLEHHMYPRKSLIEMESVRRSISQKIIYAEPSYFRYNLSLLRGYLRKHKK